MDVRRIRMSLGNLGRRRGVRIRSREKIEIRKERRGKGKEEGHLSSKSIHIIRRYFKYFLFGALTLQFLYSR